jgi:tetratricopeptide (TPR) repeat protein
MGDRKAAIDLLKAAQDSVNDLNNPQRLTHALHLLSSACMVDPTFDQAFYNIGNVHSELNQLPASIACYRRALQCSPNQELEAKIANNISWRLHNLGFVDESLHYGLRAVELDPNLHIAWVTLSCLYQTLSDADKEYETALRGYDLFPSDPMSELQYAFGCLYSRRLAMGFKHYESRFPYQLKNYLQLPYPKWNGEDGHTIFIDADQGLGDTLSFARFIPAAAKKCRYIHCAVQPELLRLFTHAFVMFDNVNVYAKPAPFPAADYWSTFVSLPYNLGLTDDEIRNAPHIEVPQVISPMNWKVPDRKLHVGIAWFGSALNNINRHRSIPVTQFFELYKVPGVQLYAMQVGQGSQDLYDNNGLALVRDLSPAIRDVVDTVGLIRHLDLIITCESALGHIAALAGKESWVPYSFLGRDYRIGLTGADMIWTPKHRTFNQGKGETWGPVFDRIGLALERRIAGAKEKKRAYET